MNGITIASRGVEHEQMAIVYIVRQNKNTICYEINVYNMGRGAQKDKYGSPGSRKSWGDG